MTREITLALSEAQADGRACLACGAESEAMAPVGTVDGCQTFACVGACAGFIGILGGAS